MSATGANAETMREIGAVIRGRARTHRRRNALLAAAAALVVVAGGGGAWLLQGVLPGGHTTTSASAPEVMSDSGSSNKAGSGIEGSAGGREQPTPAAGRDNAPAPAAGRRSCGRTTPAR